MNRKDFLKLAALGSVPFFLQPNKTFAALSELGMSRHDFGQNFKWGVATAAYQIEGAWNADGKGPSVWDTFTHKKGKVKNRENGDVACDFYNRYAEDIAFIPYMNMDVYRFSLAWSRIFPQGKGQVNQKGLDFYHRVIDKCLELNVEPWITLYHWDLPQALEDEGGWKNRDVTGWFADYADLVTRTYGDKVKNWMVLNEPMAFVGLGYLAGMHAPGKRGPWNFLPATHHTALVQADGGRIIRSNVKGANVGTTFSCSHVEPKEDTPRHRKAARIIDAMLNRLFIEPAVGLGYPIDGFEKLKKIEKYIRPGDMEKLKFDFDFIGVQNYSRVIARKALWPPYVWSNAVDAKKIEGAELTEMGWEVYPEGIYKVLKKFAAYPGVDKIIVTENGAAFPDKVENGRVNDPRRIQFFKDYLANVLRAMRDGVNLQGYLVWTLMDNFEWAEGYHPRFGLVYVDFETQQRYLKDSGKWFREFLSK